LAISKNVVAKRNQAMWRGLLAVAVFGLLSGGARAQTSDADVNPGGGIFLASALNIISTPAGQNSPAETLTTGSSYSASYDFDLGNGFKTEIEGLSAGATATRLGGLAASGNLTGTRVTLKGMYEFRDGEWRVKSFLGAGFGMIDVNEHVLGLAQNDWAGAYQLRGGVTLGFNQKLLGSLEYQWAMGSKPHFSLAGIPTKLEVDRHGFVLGVNYKY
jgi:opacity protein-like surface antigen